MRIGHDESVPVRVSVDVFWYALAYLAYGKGVTVWDVSGKEKIVRPEIIQQSHCKTGFPPKW